MLGGSMGLDCMGLSAGSRKAQPNRNALLQVVLSKDPLLDLKHKDCMKVYKLPSMQPNRRLCPCALSTGQQNASWTMLHACMHTPGCKKSVKIFHRKLMGRPPCNAKQPVFCLHLESLEIRLRSALAWGKCWILTASSAGSRRWSLSIIRRKIVLHCCGSLLNYIIFIFSVLKLYHLKWSVLCNQAILEPQLKNSITMGVLWNGKI